MTVQGWGASTRAPLLRGALIVAALALLYLARPIAGLFDGAYFSPADISQRYELTSLDPEHVPGHALMSDVWVQMHAWALHDSREIARGRFPLWNPLNAGGEPHFANYQSALLSPFSWPAYVLPFRVALVVAAFAKLFLLGWFTFLFLRELRLSFAACVLGAVVYQFGGHNLLLLSYPHSGVAVLLPAGLFLVERLARRFEDELERGFARRAWWRARSAGLLACLALACGLGALAGHPETLYFCALFVFLYALVRLIGLWRAAVRVPGAARELAITAGHALLAGALGFGLAAIQIVPFLEYLRESAIYVERNAVQTPLALSNWPLLFFPDALGNPTTSYFLRDELPHPTYEIANLVYVGPITLVLALLALPLARNRRALVFFGASAVAWFLYAHDIAGFGRLVQHIPTLDLAPPNRSQALWIAACAVLAALALDGLIKRERAPRPLLAFSLFSGTLCIFALGFNGTFALICDVVPSASEPSTQAFDPLYLQTAKQGFWQGLGALALLLACSMRRGRSLCGGLIVLGVLGQTAFLWRRYHPLCAERFFFPRTELVETLKSKVGDASVLVMGPDLLPPETNLAYGVRQIQSYDAMNVRRYDALYDELLDKRNNWRTVDHATSRALDLFGVEYIAALRGWPKIDTSFPEDPKRDVVEPSDSIVAGSEFVQEFAGVSADLDAVLLRFWTRGEEEACTVSMALEDAATGDRLAERTLQSSQLDLGADGWLRARLDVPVAANSRGRALRLRISSPDAKPRCLLRVLVRRDARDAVGAAIARESGTNYKRDAPLPPFESWKLTHDTTGLEGSLWLDLAHAGRALEHVADLGQLELFRRRDAAGRYHTVGRAIRASTDKEAYFRTSFQPLDPRREAVILDPDGTIGATVADAAIEPVRIVREEPDSIELDVERSAPGWLVTSMPWYPGWIARVDGVEREIVRANFAFAAVALPAGSSRVELVYQPSSFRIGAALSAACALLLALWLVASIEREPRA